MPVLDRRVQMDDHTCHTCNQEVSTGSIAERALRGSAEAQFVLGCMYEYGDDGLGPDFKTAMEWYLKAAEQGQADAQRALARGYYFGYGAEQDYGRALYWYEQSCSSENAETLAILAIMHQRGLGTARCLKTAVERLTAALACGFDPAKIPGLNPGRGGAKP